MTEPVEREIHQLRALIGSDRDPDGRAFAPLAEALRRAGRHEEALEVLSEGLERHPSFASGHVVAGRVHRDRGDADGAASAFRRVLELDRENVVALHGLGRVLTEQGWSDEAGGFLARAAELGYTGDPEEEPAPAPGRVGGPPEGEAMAVQEVPVETSTDVPGAERPVAGGTPEEVDVERPVAEEVAEEAAGREPGAGELPEDAAAEQPVAKARERDVSGEEAAAPEREATPELAGAGVDEEPVTAAGHEFLEGIGVFAGPLELDEGEEVEGPLTRTMAELYVRQGMPDRALRVYEHLLRERPDDEELRSRLEELRSRIEIAGEGAASGREGAGAVSASAGEAAAAEEELETVAREMTRSGHSEPVESPFAWTEGEEGDASEVPSPPPAEPVSAYFASLLSYRPGSAAGTVEPPAVDVAALAPAEPGEGEEVMDVAALAPAGPGEGEGVMDVDALAPDEPTGGPATIDIGGLAPDADSSGDPELSGEEDPGVLDVGALAPDEPEEDR